MESGREAAVLTVVADAEPFEILRAAYGRHAFAPHAHDTLAVAVLEAGASRMRYRGAVHHHRPGSVIVVAPGEAHTGEADGVDEWRYRALYLPASLVASATGALRLAVPHFAASSYDDPELAARLLVLHRALERDGAALRPASQLREWVGDLVARHACLGAPPVRVGHEAAAVRRVREHLEANAARQVTLAELSALAALSPFHLIRVFRRAVGMPPYAYLEQVRVARAREMLRSGEPTSRVAYLAGYSDQSHFTRQFKRVVGVPPGHYARAHAAARDAGAASGVA